MARLKTKVEFLDDHLASGERESPDADYLAWKERKIRRALDQADDPGQMTSAEQVWKDLGLEH